MADETKQIEAEGADQAVLSGRSLDIKVAALGLLAFLLLMFVLTRWLFPTGISINDDSLGKTGAEPDGSTHREVSYSDQDGETGASVAEVISIRRNVQVRGADELAWSNAREGAVLANRDSLQTSRHSGATVKFDDNSQIQIGSDSLIVFQRGVSDPFTARRTNSIVMMEGTLGAQFASSDEDPLHLEVALPNGVARFVGGDSDAAVAFNINVNPDLSSSVSVMSGTGVVTIGGHTATIDAEHGMTISIKGEVLEESKLPGLPTGIRPHDRVVYEYRALPPEVGFSWNAIAGIDRYRFRLARDAEMSDIVIDERLGARQFEYGGLQDSTYYWRVSAMDGFLEGPASALHTVRLVRDTQPPALKLQPSEVLAGQNAVVVRGHTDPAALVYIQGEAIVTAAGSFEQQVPIDPGTNLIVVEAVDDAGNVAYDSQIINSNTTINGGGK
ncbi:MAG: FecR domain-containing protein [Gammaproteobacteria bacterium]|nr:FecR domain-containing protein [Gammaproteobacteria bacterium]